MSSPRSSQAPTSLGACACFNVRNAARVITDLYDRTLEPAGVRTTQFAILAAINLRGGVSMQDLAVELGLDPSTMTRTLRPLEDAGLVRLAAGTDRRVKEAQLTASGKKKVVQCNRLWREAQNALREKVGAERFARIVDDLGAITEVLRG